MARDVAGGEAEGRRQPEAFGGYGQPALKDQPDGQRQVEEDMRQHHPGQPVDGDGRNPDGAKRGVEEPRAAKDREDTHDGDDHRQDEGRTKERDEKPPPRKAPPRQRARDRHRQKDAEARRQHRLPQREAQRRPVGGIRPGRTPGPRQHSQQRADGQKGRDRRRPARRKGKRPRPHRLSAARHSAMAASRTASASSAGNSSALSGVTSVSNPAGSPPSGVTAGYIQFVSGITD